LNWERERFLGDKFATGRKKWKKPSGIADSTICASKYSSYLSKLIINI
jgi:hypothetical protein